MNWLAGKCGMSCDESTASLMDTLCELGVDEGFVPSDESITSNQTSATSQSESNHTMFSNSACYDGKEPNSLSLFTAHIF